MLSYQEEKRRAQEVIRYHLLQRAELITLAWRIVEDALENTGAYRLTLDEIQRHERIVAAFQREYGMTAARAQGGHDADRP